MSNTAFHLTFHQASAPITDPVSKLGGQPCWVGTPTWPLSKNTGKKMTFIGQIRLGGESSENARPICLAYMFMTGAGFDSDADGTWDPDLGENAVVIQPGIYEGPSTPSATGPTVTHWRFDTPNVDRSGLAEFQIRTELRAEHPFISEADLYAMESSERDRILESWWGVKSGGSPSWVQGEEFPFETWYLVFQADDSALPVAVNFGTGVGYCFANHDLTKAKFLWQC